MDDLSNWLENHWPLSNLKSTGLVHRMPYRVIFHYKLLSLIEYDILKPV